MQDLSLGGGGDGIVARGELNRSVSLHVLTHPGAPNHDHTNRSSWETLKHRHSATDLFKRLSSRGIVCHDDESAVQPTMPAECARFLFEREKRRSIFGNFVPPRCSTTLVLNQLCSSSNLLNDTSLHRHKEKKGVTFTTVEIRTFPIIVGDHPGGVKGVPVTIGWDILDTVVADLEQYESIHATNRRTMQEMRMGIEHREKLLRSLGFSRQEILAGLKIANLVRNSRRKTNETQQLDAINEVVEAVSRKMRNLVTLGRRKRRERALLSRCVPHGIAIAAKQGSGWSSVSSRTEDLDTSISSAGKPTSLRSILRVRVNPSLDPHLESLTVPISG